MNVLGIDAEKRKWEVRSVPEIGPVERGIALIEAGQNCFSFYCGPFAHTNLPGLHRLIFPNWVNVWDGFYLSSLGGGGIPLIRTGIHGVEIVSRSPKPLVLIIKNTGKLSVVFEEVTNIDAIFAGYGDDPTAEGFRKRPLPTETIHTAGVQTDNSENTLFRGTRAFHQYLFDSYSERYIRDEADFRILATGPASFSTNMGSICSTRIQHGKVVPGLDSWVGRGGQGSTLVGEHNIAGIIYGGNQKPVFQKQNDIELLFKKIFGNGMMRTVKETTTLYSYEPAIGTGGTFGANFISTQNELLANNWQTINLSDEKRQELFDLLIQDHYLAQFNREMIEPRNFNTCGETCPTVCRKYNPTSGKKKDYEPYSANGPNIGIFDQEAAERIVEHIDMLGLDSIESGNMISWIMELLSKGIIDREWLGVQGEPKFDVNDVKVEYAHQNASVAIEIADAILKNPVFQKGMRSAALQLGKEARNRAMYTPHHKGSISPCLYWVPGYVLPLAIQGKFLSDFDAVFKPPRELGRTSTERMIKEMYSDNLGACRFHNAWLEELAPYLFREILEEERDLYQYSKSLIRRLYALDGHQEFDAPWESDRVYEMLSAYLEKRLRDEGEGNHFDELSYWIKKFRKDKREAGKEYWNEVLLGIRDVVG